MFHDVTCSEKNMAWYQVNVFRIPDQIEIEECLKEAIEI